MGILQGEAYDFNEKFSTMSCLIGHGYEDKNEEFRQNTDVFYILEVVNT